MRYQSLSIKDLQVVAFDWDNTLALTREALVRAINEVLHQQQMPNWEVVKQQRNPDLSFRDNFAVIFGDRAEEMYAKYREIYLQIAPQIVKVPDGATDILHLLQKKHIKVVIVSNKERELLLREKDYLYPLIEFDRIVCGHEAPRDKPHGEQLIYAVQGMVDVINPQNVWLVGDSPMDSRCALSAGARAIRVGQPIWNSAESESEAATIDYFADFGEFYRALEAENHDN